MSAEWFLDTNVLLYFWDEREPVKRERAVALMADSLRDGRGCVSWQVVQETLNVLIHKARSPIPWDEVGSWMTHAVHPLWTVFPTPAIYRAAMEIHRSTRYRFYDSLILASAMAAGAATLYSEDLQDGHRVEGLHIVNPFR